jgi:hypothetical protein
LASLIVKTKPPYTQRERTGNGAPDYAQCTGFFELMQDLYALEMIYKKRIDSGEIED